MMTNARCFALAALLFASTLFTAPAPAQSATQSTSPGASNDLGIQQLRYVTVVVRDYDEALRWYTSVLGLEKAEEASFGAGRRWLVVAPHGQKDFGIVLEIANPYGPGDTIHNYSERVGMETRWVFNVDNCHTFYDKASKRGVKFIEAPIDTPYGCEAMFQDLYGNLFHISSGWKKPASASR